VKTFVTIFLNNYKQLHGDDLAMKNFWKTSRKTSEGVSIAPKMELFDWLRQSIKILSAKSSALQLATPNLE
jgi:hypothetical protein